MAEVTTRAQDLARDMLDRLADPDTLDTAIASTERDTAFAEFTRWRPGSLSGGHAGLALLFAAADRRWPEQGWDRVGHRHLTAAGSRFDGVAHPDTSLSTGLAGLGHAAVALAAGRPRYRRLLSGVDATLLRFLVHDFRRAEQARGCPVGVFDLISGLTGTGVYLLGRTGDPDAAAALRAVAGALAGLLSDRGEPRRWHTPADMAGGPLRDAYPGGLHNCGLAHGVPGPLALLSLVLLDDVAGDRRAEVADAVRTAAGWLVEHRIDRPEGPDWPSGIGLPGTRPEPDHGDLPGRAAWCYGSPGVARALWLAGTALDEPEPAAVALRTVRGVLERPDADLGLVSPTFCHGTAGLLQITTRFARDTGDPAVAAGADRLLHRLLDEYDPGAVVGYRDVEAGGTWVDDPGLLSGSAGVALTVLYAGPDAPDPAWDRTFLLS